MPKLVHLSGSQTGVLTRFLLALSVLVAVWLPHFAHFRIDRSPVEIFTVAAAEVTPTDAVLTEVASMRLAIKLGVPPERAVETAESALSGVVDLPSLLGSQLRLGGYPADMRVGGPSAQLVLASLALEGLLLDAYDRTGDQRYLRLAATRVLEFSAYEASQFESRDFLWNDHAVAARVAVLAHLWRTCRDGNLVGREARREIISLVQRSGRLLSSRKQFTVSTNHGVMQNVALLQIGAAFPTLPEVAEWRHLALERLRLQLAFYVSPEGFVLEHSAEYHAFGAELLTQAVRLCHLNGIEPPEWLVHAAQLAVRQLTFLLRPDGSLPLIGNTSAGSRFTIPVVPDDGGKAILELAPKQHLNSYVPLLMPVAGYAVWWTRNAEGEGGSQTVINWAKHDGHGHKHADEGAVQLWADGIDWITSTGYWPYGADGVTEAYGWRSSNALHRVDEASMERRSSNLLSYIFSATLLALDFERRGEDGSVYRRQLVQIDAATLLVIDFASVTDRGSESIWTFSPQLELSEDQRGGLFVASAPMQRRRLWISIDTAPQGQITQLRGSRLPFAGWVVSNNIPTPSYALRVTTPSLDSIRATLFALREGEQSNGVLVRLTQGATPDNWDAVLMEGNGRLHVKRVSENLTIVKPAQASRDFAWTAGPDITSKRDALKEAYVRATQLYPPWRDLSKYRRKLCYLIAATAAIVELGWQIFVRSRLNSPRRRQLAGVLIVLLWASISVWALYFYLR